MSETVRETIEAVISLLKDGGGDGVSLSGLAKRLKLDKSSTSRRARDAIAPLREGIEPSPSPVAEDVEEEAAWTL